jgi:hypothetical protein
LPSPSAPAAPPGGTTTPKTKTNPIGGASAFSWLKPAAGATGAGVASGGLK